MDAALQPNPELCERQLDRYVGMYQHHYELFVKAMFFYFVAVGAIGSYVFRPEAGTAQQRWFLLTVISTSVASLVGCWISLRWWSAVRDATIAYVVGCL
jgi:hypothetical protein